MNYEPLLTTTEPGFMGSVGPLLPHQLKALGERKIVNAPARIYFHGKLQSYLGYDIPILLKGEMFFPTHDSFSVFVLHPDPEVEEIIEAQCWRKEAGLWYITYPEEVEES
jgi:hypothetical protein